HREKERQCRKRIEIFDPACCGEVAVEHDICGLRQTTFQQVHQQEGEIVEHVAGGDDLAELDGVEQNRFAVDQHDVAKMKIAVDTSYEAAPAALAQQRNDPFIGGAA